MKAFKVVILFLLVCLVGASTSIASETTIWSIGEEDGSNAEFALNIWVSGTAIAPTVKW